MASTMASSVELQPALDENAVAVSMVGCQQLEGIDRIRVEVPPSTNDADVGGTRELIGDDRIDLESLTGARSRIDTECEEVIVGCLLAGTHICRVRSELHMLAEHHVSCDANS